MKDIDLTTGKITKKLWAFALPLMLGNILQQFYNLVDTWVVGTFVNSNALAAVGSAYTLMTFLTSIIIGLCLGTSAFFSISLGQKDYKKIKDGKFVSLFMIGIFTVLMTAVVFWQCDNLIRLLQVPDEIFNLMKDYLLIIFAGIFATFIYNYYSNFLRAIGNSRVPLLFLGVSVLMNVALDLYFVAYLKQGVAGAALATVISQYVSAFGIFLFSVIKYRKFNVQRENVVFNKSVIKNILSLSGATCLQQSVMNLGILAVQGIVNTFDASVMSAFAVAVKIDTLAYMPVQDFGNAFSTFIAQNFGANKEDRIKTGIKQSILSVFAFCVVISSAVCIFAPKLMGVFISNNQADIIGIGTRYLRVEGTFYFGIGVLFMFYGYYRAINKPMMSVVLTVISLGTRVLLSLFLSQVPSIGVLGIWVSIPIGWFFADFVGIIYYFYIKNKKTG